MYTWLPSLCGELRATLITAYWLLIVPVVLLQILLEYFKLPERAPDIPNVIKRAFISIILLISFEEILRVISLVGDGLSESIGGLADVKLVLKEMAHFLDAMELSWTKLKQTLIFAFSLISYIAAYLGVFVADALIHFCWAILYVVSPLMILAYIPPGTSRTCTNLYKSLCTIMCWKVLWSILGALLLKLSTTIPIQEGENYNAILLIVTNLFIGASMLFVPFATKSLINDGFSMFASGLAALPAMTAQKTFLKYAKHLSKRGINKASGATWESAARAGRQIKRVPIWTKKRALRKKPSERVNRTPQPS